MKRITIIAIAPSFHKYDISLAKNMASNSSFSFQLYEYKWVDDIFLFDNVKNINSKINIEKTLVKDSKSRKNDNGFIKRNHELYEEIMKEKKLNEEIFYKINIKKLKIYVAISYLNRNIVSIVKQEKNYVIYFFDKKILGI